jgi:hypothetical protein
MCVPPFSCVVEPPRGYGSTPGRLVAASEQQGGGDDAVRTKRGSRNSQTSIQFARCDVLGLRESKGSWGAPRRALDAACELTHSRGGLVWVSVSSAQLDGRPEARAHTKASRTIQRLGGRQTEARLSINKQMYISSDERRTYICVDAAGMRVAEEDAAHRDTCDHRRRRVRRRRRRGGGGAGAAAPGVRPRSGWCSESPRV